MKKSLLFILAFVILTAGIFYFVNLRENQDKEIVEIPIEEVKGISEEEAVNLCFSYFGKKDKETGFLFSFGVSGAVKQGKKQYYTVRGSWLVNNSHMSYIGDFFVSADGKRIYQGIALPGEYKIEDLLWKR